MNIKLFTKNQPGNFKTSANFLFRVCVSILLPFLLGCNSGNKPSENSSDKPYVCATTTYINDLALNLVGDRMDVRGIMMPGQDPHIYDPRPSDALLLKRAKVILINGLHLEATLGHIVDNNVSEGAVLKKLAENPKITPIESQQYKGAPDPHCWFNITYYKAYTESARDALIEADPEGRTVYEKNAEDYMVRLDSLDREIRVLFSKIPEEKKILLTAHDAFNYFGEEYGFEVMGVIGLSTDAQPKPGDIESLKQQIRENNVPALFVETSVSQMLNDIVRKIAEQTGAVIGGTLYSDSLDDPSRGPSTYIEVVRYNARTIYNALTAGMAQ